MTRLSNSLQSIVLVDKNVIVYVGIISSNPGSFANDSIFNAFRPPSEEIEKYEIILITDTYITQSHTTLINKSAVWC